MPPKDKKVKANEDSPAVPPTPRGQGAGMLYMAIPIVVAVVAASFGGFLTLSPRSKPVPAAHHRASQPKTSPHSSESGNKGKAALAAALNKTSPWLGDANFEAESSSASPSCGFRVLEANDLRPEMFQEGGDLENMPLLVRGLTTKWPAHENWERTRLIEVLGNRTILAGSESSIVYGGGTATLPMKLSTFLASMRRPSNVMPDAFTFDVSVLESIPELSKDYRVPLMFKNWDSPEARKDGNVWHMLSLGPSRTGLPFHSHGKTWLALIHGSKRWLVYPPGFNPPPEIQRQFDPLRSVHSWLAEIHSTLAHLPTAPVDVSSLATATAADAAADAGTKASGGGGLYTRPIECIQRPGDIVYLPPGWAHMTVNIGEAIGIGGQGSMPVEQRLEIGRAAVARNSDNFDGHKFVALALSHQGLEEEHRVKSQLTATSSGLVQLREDNFEELVLAGEDTWLVLFSLVGQELARGGDEGDSHSQAPPFHKTWNEVASKLRGIVSVAAINVTSSWSPALAAEIRAQGGKPVVKVLLGSNDRSSVHECLSKAESLIKAVDSHHDADDVAEAGVQASLDAWGAYAEELVDFALDCTSRGGGAGQKPGSAIAVTAKGRRLFAEAEVHQRRCLELQPLHPEGQGLLAELLGHAGHTQSMREALEKAEALYDELRPEAYSPHSLASVYHKLATVYLGKEMGSNALPLLSKALGIEPMYLPALIDTAIAHLYERDHSAVEKALIKVERHSPGHGTVKKIREAMGRGKTPKGNAARRSMMGQPVKGKPGPGHGSAGGRGGHGGRGGGGSGGGMSREEMARMLQAKGGPAAKLKGVPGAGAGTMRKEFTPDAAQGAKGMMEQMKAQLEAEVQRRKANGQM